MKHEEAECFVVRRREIYFCNENSIFSLREGDHPWTSGPRTSGPADHAHACNILHMEKGTIVSHVLPYT